jgi:hypothetical protein
MNAGSNPEMHLPIVALSFTIAYATITFYSSPVAQYYPTAYSKGWCPSPGKHLSTKVISVMLMLTPRFFLLENQKHYPMSISY